jgi:hypothetical protein
MLETAGNAVVVTTLGIWWLVSAANQLSDGRFTSGLKRRDRYSLIPVWTFFAPKPFTEDLDLLYRDRYSGGVIGQWSLVPIQERSVRHLLWNPRCRSSKAVLDVCMDLLQSLAADRGSDPAELNSYNLLRLLVSQFPADEGVVERQFAVVKSSGYRLPQTIAVLVLSPFGPL